VKIDIQTLPGYLRAEIGGRTSADQGREAGAAIFAAQAESGLRKILVVVHGSDPIFRVEQYSLSEMLKRAADIGLRVALVSDTKELLASHQYVEMLARQRGVELRSFRDEAVALKWLLGNH
jgi:hypothetical protein